jgi:hypothetical protein
VRTERYEEASQIWNRLVAKKEFHLKALGLR